MTAGRYLVTFTWRDQYRDSNVLQSQTATTLIHLSSRKLLIDDGLALSRFVHLLLEDIYFLIVVPEGSVLRIQFLMRSG